MRAIFLNIVVLIFTAALLASCSVQENTLLTRTYHQITSKYNTFFNARQSFDRGLGKINSQYRYDYSRILPVFTQTDPELALSVQPEMERAVAKANKIISNKSITARPREYGRIFTRDAEFYNRREYNRWVPESYMLMGKAYFYMHDFEFAAESFRFAAFEYDYASVGFEAMLWLARSYNKLGNFREAGIILEDMDENSDFPSNLQGELNATFADHFIKQGSNEKAVAYLEKALDFNPSADERKRYIFILGQINKFAEYTEEAARYFEKVVAMDPGYEMVLKAQIGLAGAYPSGSLENEALQGDLYGMLEDPKNEDYKDQIYYALGILYDQEGDEEKALEMFRLSSAFAGGSSSQKAVAYETIAGIYLDNKDYIKAQAYYDSTVMFMDPGIPGYADIAEKAGVLTELTGYINSVELEDSLQYLAQLPEKELNYRIDEIIAAAGEENPQEPMNEQGSGGEGNKSARELQSFRLQAERTVDGQWYFYNRPAVTFGKAEFQAVWGSRNLEDNWRRSGHQETVSGGSEPEDAEVEQKTEEAVLADAPEVRQIYLQDIPFTEEDIDLSHRNIQNALIGMSSVYAEHLNDYLNAAKALEEFIERYPSKTSIPSLCYRLYKLYGRLNDPARAGEYKDLLINRYPESRYAAIVKNPEYLDEINQVHQEAEIYYEQTRGLFLDQEYESVIKRADNAREKFGETTLMPLFEYLEILSAAGLSGNISELKYDLREYVNKYPETELSENAGDLIEYLDRDYPDFAGRLDLAVGGTEFETGEREDHFFILVIENREELVNRMTFNIINFNVDHFPRLDLEVAGQEFSSRQRLLVVRGLENREVAMDYLQNFRSSPDVLKETGITTPASFVISASNYPVFMDEKNIENYLMFFRDEYEE